VELGDVPLKPIDPVLCRLQLLLEVADLGAQRLVLAAKIARALLGRDGTAGETSPKAESGDHESESSV